MRKNGAIESLLSYDTYQTSDSDGDQPVKEQTPFMDIAKIGAISMMVLTTGYQEEDLIGVCERYGDITEKIFFGFSKKESHLSRKPNLSVLNTNSA